MAVEGGFHEGGEQALPQHLLAQFHQLSERRGSEIEISSGKFCLACLVSRVFWWSDAVLSVEIKRKLMSSTTLFTFTLFPKIY